MSGWLLIAATGFAGLLMICSGVPGLMAIVFFGFLPYLAAIEEYRRHRRRRSQR